MKAVELAKLVLEMRQAQREYFRLRSDSALHEAKRLESKVDRVCDSVLDGQQELFPKE